MEEGIFSQEEFLARLKKGDKFWYIEVWKHAPSEVRGPVTISRIAEDKSGMRVFFREANMTPRYISYLTNEHQGVFLTEVAALACFKERKRAFPRNIEERLNSDLYDEVRLLRPSDEY